MIAHSEGCFQHGQRIAIVPKWYAQPQLDITVIHMLS